MGVQLINIGFGNMAAATRVIAIISPESAPVKRCLLYTSPSPRD